MAFLLIAFKSKMTYRSSVIFTVMGSVIEIWLKLCLWGYLYRDNREMIEYMIMYTVLSNMIALFYIDKITWLIGNKITDGSITADLLKPYHFIFANYMQCLGELLADFLMKGIPILIFFGLYIFRYADRIMLHQVPAALLAIVLGHILHVLLFTIIGLSAMVFLEIWAVHRIVRDIIQFLSGAFIPLSLFPDVLFQINRLLPFRFLFSFPLELLLNDLPGGVQMGNFMILTVWILFFTGSIWILEKRLMRKLIIQGG